MRSTVDQLSWVESLYPSNIAKKIASDLDGVSDWLKTSRKPVESASKSNEQGSDVRYSSGDRYVQLS